MLAGQYIGLSSNPSARLSHVPELSHLAATAEELQNPGRTQGEMLCFMPWLRKLLTTDVFPTTLTSLQMTGEPRGIPIRGPTRGRCGAARTLSSVLAPRQARAHRHLSPLAPALLVRVFKFETCGFSRPSGAPAAGEGGTARQPTQSLRLVARPEDVAAPRAHVQPRPAPSRTRATACRGSGAARSTQCPGCSARRRARPQSAELQPGSDWAGRGWLGGVGRGGRSSQGRGGGGAGAAGAGRALY